MRAVRLLALGLAGTALAGVWAFWGGFSAVTAPQDRPLPRLAPEGPLHIVTFGTSLTAGYDWPGRLQEALQACLETRPVTVTTLAQPGAGSAWGVTRTDAIAALRPDLVVMEFAINDADLLDGVSRSDSRAQHARILTELRDALPETRILLMTTQPVQGLQRLKRPFLARYYRLYPGLAAEFGTGLADLTPRWRALPASAWRLPDGLHPTADQARGVILPALRVAILRALPAGVRLTCPPQTAMGAASSLPTMAPA